MIQSSESQLWIQAPWHACSVHSFLLIGTCIFNPADLFLCLPCPPPRSSVVGGSVSMGLTTYLFLWTPIKVVFELFVQYHCPLNFLTGIFCVVYIGFLLLWCQLPCRVYWSLIMATYGDSGVMADWDSLWELRAWPVSLWWPRARPPNGCQSEVVLASSGPHQNFFLFYWRVPFL